MPHSLKPRALADLDNIYLQSLEAFGADQARNYLAELTDAFEFLGDFPRAMRERSELKPPVRVYRYKAHLILYVLGPDDHVVIVRIRHGREDWLNDLF